MQGGGWVRRVGWPGGVPLVMPCCLECRNSLTATFLFLFSKPLPFFFFPGTPNNFQTYILCEKPFQGIYLKIPVVSGRSIFLKVAIYGHKEWNKGKVVSLHSLPIPLFQRPLSGLCHQKAVQVEFCEVVASGPEEIGKHYTILILAKIDVSLGHWLTPFSLSRECGI